MIINLNNLRIMIIAPHFDDEVIGCSGTIIKYRKNLQNLSVVHLAKSNIRAKEYEQISSEMKITRHYMLDGLDGFLELNQSSLVEELVLIIQTEKPDAVFLPHKDDNHPDHKAAYKIGIDAIEKARYWNSVSVGHKVNYILCYEVWTMLNSVSLVVDISEWIDRKTELMSNYISQLEFPYLQYIRTINHYRGLLHHRGGYAEAFLLQTV